MDPVESEFAKVPSANNGKESTLIEEDKEDSSSNSPLSNHITSSNIGQIRQLQDQVKKYEVERDELKQQLDQEKEKNDKHLNIKRTQEETIRNMLQKHHQQLESVHKEAENAFSQLQIEIEEHKKR